MCFLCAVCSKAFLTSLYKGPSLIYLFNIKEGGIKPAGYLPLYLRSEGINTWFDRCSCSSQCVLKVGVSSNILFSFCSKYVLSMFHSWKQLLTYRCCQNGMAWTGRNCEIGGTCVQEDEPVTEVGGVPVSRRMGPIIETENLSLLSMVEHAFNPTLGRLRQMKLCEFKTVWSTERILAHLLSFFF